MFVLIFFASFVSTYLLVNLTALYFRNRKAFKFYQEKSPNLPTVPDPSPFTGHLKSIFMTDESWKIITGLHEKYGPTFGAFYVNQPWVATKDLDLIKLIEIDEAKKHTNRAFFGGPLKHFNNSIFQIFDDDWRGARHVIAPALSNFQVKSDANAGIELVVEKFAASLRRKSQRNLAKSGTSSIEIEARDSFERFALAVIFLVSYKQDDMVDFDGDTDKWAKLFAEGARDGASPLVFLSMVFPFLRSVVTFLARYSPFGIWERSIIEHIEGEITTKRSTDSMGKQVPVDSLFSSGKRTIKPKGTLLDTVIEGYLAKKINYDHFMGSLLLLVMAGAITTADTMSCLVWQLAMNPDIQEKLRKSIEEKGVESEYLSWCINEAIRYHPAVPLGTGRILGEDVTVNGQFLAKGTFVMPSTHSIHHDPSIWPEPERFNPDRWRHQANFHPAAFVGFGLGPRNCLGRYLATHEIKLMLKMLLGQYRIEICDRTLKEWRFKVPVMLYTLMEKPLIVKLTPLSSG